MSNSKRRKQRSSTTRPSNGSRSFPAATKPSTTTSVRSSGRQVKLATQGFNFGGAAAGQREQRDAEKVEKELTRERRRKEQRIEELERGTGPSNSWNDSSSYNVLPASTSAAAIAGLLAGRQAEQEESYEDIPVSQPAAAAPNGPNGTLHAVNGNKRKQSAELKRLLGQRRSLKVLLEDASASSSFKNAPNNFLKSLNASNPYPIHQATGPVCSICGYWGDIRCLRCHERVCGLKCSTTHNETRCERRL